MADKTYFYFVKNAMSNVVDFLVIQKDNAKEAEKEALRQAVAQHADNTAVEVTAKNWKVGLAQMKGMAVKEGARERETELQAGMTRLFESLGLPAGEVREAVRGRYLDTTKTLQVLGLSSKDFKDFDDDELREGLENFEALEGSDGSDEYSHEPYELTEEQADEALERARVRLNLKGHKL